MILWDTHTWLWWLHSPDQLADRAREVLTMGEHQNSWMVSAISVWEIAVKLSIGNLPLAIDKWFAMVQTRPGIVIGPEGCARSVTLEEALPPSHSPDRHRPHAAIGGPAKTNPKRPGYN
jgi:PIN domain nuclease of toxin-antitoxin system